MAITTQGKLNELQNFQKTDGTIQNEYNNVEKQYQKEKNAYKMSKYEYKLAQEQLENAQENFKNAPLLQSISANKKVKNAKKTLKLKKEKYLLDKEKYKQKLAELKSLKNEIRNQYKKHREYVTFFLKVQEAQKIGIKLPKYITDEYNKEKANYLTEKYKIGKNGNRYYMTQPNKQCRKDVNTLIFLKNKQNVKDTITQVKENFISKEEER